MEVIATAKGYHGSLREPGESFDVPDGTKGSWFQPAEAPEPKPAPKGKGKTAEPDPGDSEI